MAKKTLEKLSKVDEGRIVAALDDISVLVNDGENPNEAITKVAKQMKLASGFIDLIVHAYNTGRTNIQRKSSDDIYTKAANFPVADANVIRKTLYPENYKTAADVHRQTSVSTEYNMSPIWLSRKQTEKKANVPFKLVDKPVDPYPTDNSRQIKHALADIDRNKRKLAQFRVEKTRMYGNCVNTLNELVDYFKTAGHQSFQEVKYNVETLHGRDGTLIMDMIKNRYPSVEKQASTTSWPSTKGREALYNKIDILIKDMTEYNKFSEKLEKASELVTKSEGQFLRPFVLSPKNRSVLPLSKEANIWGSVLDKGMEAFSGKGSEIAGELPGTKPLDSLYKKDMQKITDPDHESVLREAQVEAMLNDLMANDEIISSHKPDDVLRVFNELNQIAPRASNQKMLMRALLRKRLQYGGDQVDPFDIEQLLKIDGQLKDRDNLIGTGAMSQGPLGSIGAGFPPLTGVIR